jgi:hypothetical protein
MVLTFIIPFHSLYLYLLVTRKTYNYFETMVAVIYSLGTLISLQFLFAIMALLNHLITGNSIDLKISDFFKVCYLVWFVSDTIKLYPVKLKLLRAIVCIVLAFGTFIVWRLYAFPELVKVFHPYQ